MAVLFFTGFEWGPSYVTNFAHEIYGFYSGRAYNNVLSPAFVDSYLTLEKTGTYELKVDYQNSIGESGAVAKIPDRDEIYIQCYVYTLNLSEGYILEIMHKEVVIMLFYINSVTNKITVYKGRSTNVLNEFHNLIGMYAMSLDTECEIELLGEPAPETGTYITFENITQFGWKDLNGTTWEVTKTGDYTFTIPYNSFLAQGSGNAFESGTRTGNIIVTEDILGMSKAEECEITIATAAPETSAYVIIEGITQEEWSSCNNQLFKVTKTGDYTFTIPFDSSGFTASYDADTDQGRLKKQPYISGPCKKQLPHKLNCVEFHIRLHETDGIIEMRINKELQVLYTGNTIPVIVYDYQITTMNGVRFGSRKNNDGDFYYDNFVIYDATGTKNNSWVNGAKVVLLKPNAAGTYSQWTPYSGDNYANTNTLPPNTNYVKAATTGLKDSYNIEDLDNKFKKIIAIKEDFICKRGQDDIKNITPFIITNGQRYSFTSINVPFIEKYVPGEIIETNPITSQDFTLAEINNMEIGMESKT